MRLDWTGFLGRPEVTVDRALAEAAAHDKCVMITGGGGSIGTGLATTILVGRPRSLVLLDLSEHALYECYRRIGPVAAATAIEVIPVVGSTADERLLGRLILQHKPDLILHTAAYKHVPLMESNPFSAIGNNAVGTYLLVKAALDAGVSQLLMGSTDRAVNPQSIMGISKRIAELVLLSHWTPQTAMNAVRLGNVLGSSGSVVPIFQEQAERGAALTVTDAEARRYFLTLREAEIAILQAATTSVSGRILIPDCGEPFRIVDLARYVAENCNRNSAPTRPIEFIGLRPGDKIREELMSGDERIESEVVAGMKVVASPCPDAAKIADAIHAMEKAIDGYDHSTLMGVITELVHGRKSLQRADGASSGVRSE